MVPQVAVSRQSHGLVRHRRVYGYPPPLPRRHGAARQPRINRRLPDPLGAGGPDALARPGPAARVDERMIREIVFAATGLPVGILHPTRDHGLVRPSIPLLPILQPDHQAGGLAAATAVRVQLTESLVESWPIQDPGQADELMARVQQGFQAVSEPIVGFGQRRGSGRMLGTDMARNGA